jgi:hypothetical protein
MRTTFVFILSAIAGSSAMASTALAGPSLTAITSLSVGGTAEFNTSYGESFAVDGTTTTDIVPFATTTGLTMGMTTPDGTGPVAVGNAGTAVLAVTYLGAFDTTPATGESITGGTGLPQVQGTSGIINLGGSSTIGGSMVFNTPSQTILNRTGLAALTIAEGVNIGASITGTQVGTSSLESSFTSLSQLSNSLSAF